LEFKEVMINSMSGKQRKPPTGQQIDNQERDGQLRYTLYKRLSAEETVMRLKNER
jgi:hypothetical protein